jgi:hypothetical protein
MHRVVNSSAALAADRPATRLAVCVGFAHRSSQGFIRRRSSESHDSVVAADFVNTLNASAVRSSGILSPF